MLLIKQFFWGTLFICVTVLFHALCLDRLINLLEKASPYAFKRFKRFWRTAITICAVLGVFAALIIEIWLWAAFYYIAAKESIQSFEEALYFSTATFTTVGYGDVILDKSWRLVSSFQAANGFILFGWSTAFIFEIISKLYKTDGFSKWR